MGAEKDVRAEKKVEDRTQKSGQAQARRQRIKQHSKKGTEWGQTSKN